MDLSSPRCVAVCTSSHLGTTESAATNLSCTPRGPLLRASRVCVLVVVVAPQRGDTVEATALVAVGASVRAIGEFDGGTALHCAASSGDAAMIRLLVPAAIHSAHLTATRGCYEAIFLPLDDVVPLPIRLVRAGSLLNTRDKGGWTPLHRAAYGSHPEAAQALLDAGADFDALNAQGQCHTRAVFTCLPGGVGVGGEGVGTLLRSC